MKKTLLASLGLATSLLAITQEQQIELDRIFKEKMQKVEKQNLNPQSKNMALRLLENQKQEIQSKSDEEISAYLNGSPEDRERVEESLEGEEEPLIDESTLVRSDGWKGWIFGATGARFSAFFGGNSGGAYMAYGTIGPKYNFTYKGSSLNDEGFSLSLPIGFGAINTSGVKNDVDFVLPIALEAKYRFDSYWRFGLSAGVRYTYSPQDIGDLHIMDIYAGLDLVLGAYIEAGYVFYSSQDVKVGNKTISTDPLSGAITFNIGWRF